MSVSDADSRLDDALQSNLARMADELDPRAAKLVTSYLEAAAMCDEHTTLGSLVRSATDSALDSIDGWLDQFVPVHRDRPEWEYCYDYVRGEAREALETAACELVGLVRLCSHCGVGLTRKEWSELEFRGIQEGGPQPLELRNHACGSTISLPAQVLS